MEEIKFLSIKSSYILNSLSLEKLCRTIRSQKQTQNMPDKNIKEIDFLRDQCMSDSIEMCLLAHQSFVRMVEDGTLELAGVLAMFVSMLPGVISSNQFTAISEGIVSLLLIDLKRRTVLSAKSGDKYVCAFGLKPPQHPLIMLLQKKEIDMNDFVSRISGICNHHDKDIQGNSIEFLRPVFLYTLCNPYPMQSSKTIWSCLLTQLENDAARQLVYEILLWSKSTSSTSCLFTSILLAEAIEFGLLGHHNKFVCDCSLYLMALVNNLIQYGYDPRASLALLQKVLNDVDVSPSHLVYDRLLLSLAKTLHIISPMYLCDLTRLVKFIIVKLEQGNVIIRYMIFEGLIPWIANTTFLAVDASDDITTLVEFIQSNANTNRPQCELVTAGNQSDIKYFHPDISLYHELAILSQRITGKTGQYDNDVLSNFIDAIDTPAHLPFCNRIQLFLRGLFLTDYVAGPDWQRILSILGNVVRTNQTVSIDFVWSMLYRLTMETDARCQLELLRGMTAFAVIKEHIPIVLNCFKHCPLKSLSMDLYLRLWKCEPRTYPFLHELLSVPYGKEKDAWELNVAKAQTIREICLLKPAQHGTDLVAHLSTILNSCFGNRGDAATAIVLDAILILCNSHTVNIASTWKALSGKFHNEKRTRPVIRLCKFFGQVPLLRSPTMEYEKLYGEAIEKLWRYAVYSDRQEIIVAALTALQHFDHNQFTLKQLPDLYRQRVTLPSEFAKTPIDAQRNPADVLTYVPGECWLELLENINHSAIEAAADLIGHYIGTDISAYRSGVYMLAEGKTEPSTFQQLHKRSPLRAIVNLLVGQSNPDAKPTASSLVLTNCLRCIAQRFTKAMPPLNWFFLLEYINRDATTKWYSLQIAANQVNQSGSAKNIIENYMRHFDMQECDERDVKEMLLLMPALANSVSPAIYVSFMEMIFDYSYRMSMSDDFEAGCLFEMVLRFIGEMSAQNNCRIGDNAKGFALTVEKYFDMIGIDSKIFVKFASACCKLPLHILDPMTSPNTWWDIEAEKFKKATIIRTLLIAENKTIDNALVWLNPIIDNVTKGNIDQTFVLQHTANALSKYNNSTVACAWLMDYLGKLQSFLSVEQIKDPQCYFLFDFFILSIVVLSGYGSLLDNVDSRAHRNNLFPESLAGLFKIAEWQACSTRIYNFLYHMYLHDEVPIYLTDTARNALICLKNDEYFLQKNTWMKFVGLR